MNAGRVMASAVGIGNSYNRILKLKNCRNQKEHVIPNGVRAMRNPSCL
jgi:hypothetical protein